ncbi:transglutaminase-like putative cysteine protease [Crossiella equi]|uniref:Transglutaminase-like putative cysteine protease n=1 Tax=Crossiella equi TaxID=130796 RepID=A0ABS5AJW4_9PSEU|nr:transglutaminase family protein [Crossiella equi]MBP2476866.1 transglutaminase-like putative cysteine protease [Crossiella equi]
MRVVGDAGVGEYLGDDEVVDFRSSAVQRVVRDLPRAGYAAAAFEFVRDRVGHAVDVGERRVTVRASEVLAVGSGLCYAKAHLFVALLRARGVAAGFCYQRLADGEGGFALHGLAAVWVPGQRRWARVDPRGDKPGVRTEFDLRRERLAYPVAVADGEVDYPTVFVRPHPVVLAALRGATDTLELCAGGLPGHL